MDATDRDVCMAIRAQKLLVRNGAGALLKVLQDYSSSDGVGAIYRGTAQFFNVWKSAQMMDEYSTKFNLLPRNAEGRAQQGGNLPDASVAAP